VCVRERERESESQRKLNFFLLHSREAFQYSHWPTLFLYIFHIYIEREVQCIRCSFRKVLFILFIYVYVCVYMYACIYLHICIYIHSHTCIYTHTHIHVHTRTRTHTHTHVYSCVLSGGQHSRRLGTKRPDDRSSQGSGRHDARIPRGGPCISVRVACLCHIFLLLLLLLLLLLTEREIER